jgi:hypothetical protein
MTKLLTKYKIRKNIHYTKIWYNFFKRKLFFFDENKKTCYPFIYRQHMNSWYILNFLHKKKYLLISYVR